MKKKRKSGGGANWMDTYGDMVTLLLCFFVMLYSMSTIDQQKWQQLVQSFNPTEISTDNTFQSQTSSSDEPVDQQDVEADLDKLYQAISQYVAENTLQDQIRVEQGSGYVFISFDDTVFFEGNRYELLDEGKKVLDQIAEMMKQVSSSIREVRILGHTAQADPDKPNDPAVDRFLASNRATVVTVYLQEKNIIDPAKLVSMGYGQWRPIASNDNSEERSKNRRVEMIVTGLNLDEEINSDLVEYDLTTEDAASTANPS